MGEGPITPQLIKLPTIASKPNACKVQRKGPGSVCMIGLILEALLALVILLIIVWWTMFSGRKRGELPHAEGGEEKEEVVEEEEVVVE